MYSEKRPLRRPVIFILIIASWLLVACGARLSNTNWPSLVAEGDRVYVAYGPGVMAYDVAAGERAWFYPDEPVQAPFYAAPSLQDGRVILGDFGATGGFFNPSPTVSLYGLQEDDDETPEVLWTNSELAEARIVGSPLQVDDTAYVGTAGNKVFALNAEDGSEIWRFETGNSVWGQPTYKDGVLFVSSLDRNVYALDATTGEEIWRTALAGAIASSPVVNGDLVYVTSFDNHLHALSQSDGETQWSVEAADWIWGSPVLAEDAVYFADKPGNVYAVDALSGEQLWTQSVAGDVQTAPAVSETAVYIVSDVNAGTDEATGLLTALDVDDGGELWQQETQTPLYTTPVIVDDVVIVAVQSETALLIAFNQDTGVQAWQVGPPPPPE